MKILKIGDFEMPVLAALDIEQKYDVVKRESIFRTISQLGKKQAVPARKMKISTSGSGWIPAGLGAIDTNQQHLLACITPRILPADGVSRQATLPAGRRADAGHIPYGMAFFSSHYWQLSPATLVGNVATVTAVPDAVRYAVGYYPLVLCWIQEPTDNGPDPSWSFEAEEV